MTAAGSACSNWYSSWPRLTKLGAWWAGGSATWRLSPKTRLRGAVTRHDPRPRKIPGLPAMAGAASFPRATGAWPQGLGRLLALVRQGLSPPNISPDFRHLARRPIHPQHHTKPNVVVAIVGIVVVAIRREQVVRIIVVPRTAPQDTICPCSHFRAGFSPHPKSKKFVRFAERKEGKRNKAKREIREAPSAQTHPPPTPHETQR